MASKTPYVGQRVWFLAPEEARSYGLFVPHAGEVIAQRGGDHAGRALPSMPVDLQVRLDDGMQIWAPIHRFVIEARSTP